MTGAKSRRWTLIIVIILIVTGSGLFLGLRTYHGDIKELKRFLAAYDRFDTAMAERALRGQGDVTPDVLRALSDLQTYAGMRLSSLIRNDGELMAQAREVADLAQREVEGQPGRPGEESGNLTEKRKASFARFIEFAGTGGGAGR